MESENRELREFDELRRGDAHVPGANEAWMGSPEDNFVFPPLSFNFV